MDVAKVTALQIARDLHDERVRFVVLSEHGSVQLNYLSQSQS